MRQAEREVTVHEVNFRPFDLIWIIPAQGVLLYSLKRNCVCRFLILCLAEYRQEEAFSW